MPEVGFWDERYGADEYAYGERPNDFLVEVSGRLPASGAALDLGAGEGRNAVYLASLGLDVLAVDQSVAGLAKAERLAAARDVALRTERVDLDGYDPGESCCAVISSVFCHLPSGLRGRVHASVVRALVPGGAFVLEAYTPDQLGRGTGGPRDPGMLASLERLRGELAGLSFEIAEELVRDVVEGACHTGEASVVRVLARKPE